MLKIERETERNVNKTVPIEAYVHLKRNKIRLNLKLFYFFGKITSLMGSNDSDNNTTDNKISILALLICLIIKLFKECYKEDIKQNDSIKGFR